MEGPIFRGLTDLFLAYIASLESAITCQTNVTETSGSIIKLAVSLQQQVSVLANLSTLVHFFSRIIKSNFKGIGDFNFELMESPLVGCEHKDLALCLLLIQEASDQLSACFCQQFIYRMMSPESGCRLNPETSGTSYGDLNVFHYPMASVLLQVRIASFSDKNLMNIILQDLPRICTIPAITYIRKGLLWIQGDVKAIG